MRDRFKRSVDRLFFNPERFGELFRPFFPELDHPPVRVRKRHSNEPELTEIKGFGSNPGNLRMLQYVPAGLKPGDPLPLDSAQWDPGRATAAFDMIYRPAETPFLALARAAGCRTANGLGMLLHQGVAALEIWSYSAL